MTRYPLIPNQRICINASLTAVLFIGTTCSAGNAHTLVADGHGVVNALAPYVIAPYVMAGIAGIAGLGIGLCTMVLRNRRDRRQSDIALACSAQRFERLAEQTHDVVLRISATETSISSSVYEVLGYTATEMRSIDMGRLVHPDDLPRVLGAFESLTKGRERCDLTYRLIHRNGTIIWAEATFFLIDGDDGEPETICTIRDVSERHREAEALRLAMQAAREAQALADRANRAKDDFLASMSHEIRTPLNAIMGFADLILGMSGVATTIRRHVEHIRGGGDALLMIVNDILDLSQAEAGSLRLDPRPFALPLLLDECIAFIEPSAFAKQLAIRVELADRFPTGLMGDDGRLRQILLNLLNNAIKFTPQGEVNLRIGYDRARGADCVFCEISDTGIGIAAEDIPHLFQRFRQVDGTIRRTYGGTGLGLAICRSLVEQMGGDIGVRSEIGVGSTFWFAIDMPTAPLVLEPWASRPREERRPLTILLAEDVPINQELARTILEAQGHRVDVVDGGADAVRAVQTTRYDVVLMDVQMPEVDGITATRAIRNLPSLHRFTPIIAMTAAVLKDQIDAARAAGVDAVLPKPIEFPAVELLLARAERDELRPAPDPAAFDAPVVKRLAAVIGDAKIVAMQSLLAKSLSTRFTTTFSTEAIKAIKAEAHASIAGAAMLGFPRFASRCRAVLEADDPPQAEAAYAALREELYHVVRCAEREAETAIRQVA